MRLMVGSLLRSKTSKRRARVTGITDTMVRIEFSDRGWQWRRIDEILRLYHVI